MKRYLIALFFAGLVSACATNSNSGAASSGSSDNRQAFIAEQKQFLIDNAARDGVTVTESGLQYEQIRKGSGARPAPDDSVSVDYAGTLIDGYEFDSSYARKKPATVPLSGVIPGWTEALQLMSVGSEYRVVIPPELAYGDRGAGEHIWPGAVLVFNIELLEIYPKDPSPADLAIYLDTQKQFLIDNAAREGVTVTESGLQYEQVRAGSGTPPKLDDTVVFHYRGTLTNGLEFHNSYVRNKPVTVPLTSASLVPGWQEAVQLMSVGSEYRLVIPPELAYGDRGAGDDIRPGAVVIFKMELLDIKAQ